MLKKLSFSMTVAAFWVALSCPGNADKPNKSRFPRAPRLRGRPSFR
jgi:hypothetical protein